MKKYLTVFMLAISYFAGAQVPLSLDSAIAIALENNHAILISGKQLAIADNNNSYGNAGFYPKVDAGAAYDLFKGNAELKTITGSEIDATDAKSTNLNAYITLKWTLYDGMKMFANKEIYSKLQEVGENNLKITIETTVSKVMEAYFQLLKEMQKYKVLSEQLEVSKFRNTIAENNFKTGMGSEFEMQKATVEMNFDKLDLTKQQSTLDICKVTMNELLSRSPETAFTISDSLEIGQLLNLVEIKEKAKTANHQLVNAYKNKELSELEAKKILTNYYPTIDFKFGLNYNDAYSEISVVKDNTNYGAVVGLSANINLFDGFKDNTRHDNAKLEILNNEIKIQQLGLLIDAYIAKLYLEYKVCINTIDLEKENYLLAKKNLDIAKDSYSVGSISSIQFREVQKNYLESYERIIQAKYLVKLREIQLLLLSGQLVK